MKAFIKKHQYNYIKKCLNDLNNTFRGCVDAKIIEANKIYIQGKLLTFMSSLSEEEKSLLDISKINDPLHIDKYLRDLDEYVYGMAEVTNAQLNKLFKKEKKLKLPDLAIQESKNVYLGWINESINKLFVAYIMNDKLVGMSCRLPNYSSNNTHRCAFCNSVGDESEIAFVSPICKTANSGKDGYKSIGFNICLDSEKCNERITSVEKLETLLKDVNNIK